MAMSGLPPGVTDQGGKLNLADTKPIIDAVRRSWLADKRNQKWQLIVDSYDGPENADIGGFLPTRSSQQSTKFSAF